MNSEVLFLFLSNLTNFLYNQNLFLLDRILWILTDKLPCCSDYVRRELAGDDLPNRSKRIASDCIGWIIEGIIKNAKADCRVEGYGKLSPIYILNEHYSLLPYEVKVIDISR